MEWPLLIEVSTGISSYCVVVMVIVVVGIYTKH